MRCTSLRQATQFTFCASLYLLLCVCVWSLAFWNNSFKKNRPLFYGGLAALCWSPILSHFSILLNLAKRVGRYRMFAAKFRWSKRIVRATEWVWPFFSFILILYLLFSFAFLVFESWTMHTISRCKFSVCVYNFQLNSNVKMRCFSYCSHQHLATFFLIYSTFFHSFLILLCCRCRHLFGSFFPVGFRKPNDTQRKCGKNVTSSILFEE